MVSEGLIHLHPTLAMLTDELHRAGISCSSQISDSCRTFSGVRLWRSGAAVQPDLLYVAPAGAALPEGCAAAVPELLPGRADTLCCPGQEPEELLNLLLEIFCRLREQEMAIDQLVCRGGSLQELCDLGTAMLGNPICIHDDWFILVAMSAGFDSLMMPEYIASSSKGFIPRIILDEFQHDTEYLETFAHRDAQLWYGSNGQPASLYVNLWDGAIYRGRLLVILHRREFRPVDFLLAQALTQRALLLLQRKHPGEQQALRSMDDQIYDLIRGKPLDSTDLAQLLSLLGWKRSDRYLCIRIRSQQEQISTLMEHMLHSDLFRTFPGSYIMFIDREQCVIVNLSRDQSSSAEVRSRLAPLCRDYCMYAGTSSPVTDIRDLHLAYHQAQVALQTAFRLRSEKWNVLFSECAMEYLLERLDSPLPPLSLVSPELLAVLEHDRNKGTQYFQTLRTYLLEERDIPRTAEKLIIHRTTLLYRLKKIVPMIGVDLNDPWVRLYLILSLWILEQEAGK